MSSRGRAWTRRELLQRGAAGAAAAALANLPLGICPAEPALAADSPRPGASPAVVATRQPGPERGQGALAGDAADRQTATLLREMLLQRALDSTEPWLIAHLVLALGRDVAARGKPILDTMVEQSVTTTTIGGRTYPHFELRLERHPFHFLQIMQATDVPRERAFATPQGRFTRQELIAGSEAVFDPTAQSDEASWTVCVLTHELPPQSDRFRTARGTEVVVADLVERHLVDTEAAYAAVFASMTEGRPYGRGPIHSKACNGTHLVYGLIDAAHRGYTGNGLGRRMARLLDATIFRLQLEQKLVDASLRGEDPLVRLNVDAVKLSFLGHAIEDLGHAIRTGVFVPTPAQLAAIGQARRQLGGVAERITQQHDLDELRARVPDAYSLVLGDACHALRGIGYWT